MGADDMEYTGIFDRFDINEKITECRPYGAGHINSTFLATAENGKRYLLQAINTDIFRNPEGVMENIARVSAHLFAKEGDRRRVMTAVPARDGGYLCRAEGKTWRVLDYVEDSLCLELPENEADVYECGFAFGSFQRLLSDLDASVLCETIPDFHNTPKRYADLLSAAERDVCGRLKGAKEELDFIKSREKLIYVLADAYEKGIIPLRVTHNDTKINNVLLDRDTRKALCVIDLDTVMPGFSVNDFGDGIRTTAATAAEDERDLSKVHFDIALYKAYARGFIDGCGGGLTEAEIKLLPEGAMLMTLECGMRFLTDYLSGDTYFKTSYAEHNLVRCRTQLKMLAEMSEQLSAMRAAVGAGNL